jgi:3-oxoacyl-[acyl-carrier-protein] synthase II
MKRRVAITGMGVATPLGMTVEEVVRNIHANQCATEFIAEWNQYQGLRTRVGTRVKSFDEKVIPRQMRRSMSRVAQLAVSATQQAILDAKLGKELLETERTGISYGSTMGGMIPAEQCFAAFNSSSGFHGILSSTFLQIMSHTCASNLALAFSIPGRTIASCTACASSTQAIGFGYEAIQQGIVDRMLCGGAEELHIAMVGAFDVMNATSSHFNVAPHLSPRPFSGDRDGIVVGEGAGTFVLEDWDSAVQRGAKIHAEVVGFYTNTDGLHISNPSVEGMEKVMRGALTQAGLEPQDISYVNAHATGTEVGDVAESHAIYKVFGEGVPVSSLKGHLGHLMGACGVVEAAACVNLLNEQYVAPTLHLEVPDPACAPLNYVMRCTKRHEQRFILKNSFAIGGINATLILKKV